MQNPAQPHSTVFNEHYWSGGAPEKIHVFLQGNNLPARFVTARTFTVAELGFGTGLNFLLTTRLWQQAAPTGAHLTYISYELYPLSLNQLQSIHAAFLPELQTLASQLLALYNLQSGWNTLSFPQITLHLYIGDALTGIPTHPQSADAWFLDGFSPLNNPDMWQPELLNQIAIHTNPGGTASTYSVASRVQKGLAAAGFQIEQIKGFPPKGRMLHAVKNGLPAAL